VHTYNDISPVIAADMTYDIDGESTLLKVSGDIVETHSQSHRVEYVVAVHMQYARRIPEVHLQYACRIPAVHMQYARRIPEVHLQYARRIPAVHMQYTCSTPAVQNHHSPV
jgi:hypothetical protein